MFVWIRYHPVSQEQLTDSQCLDPVAKSELDGNRYWDQDSRPLSKVLASFHGQHPESASSLVTGLLWQDSLDTGPYTLESLFLLSFYCYQKRRLLLRREVVLGSLLDTCAPHGGSFLVEGGTGCSPLSSALWGGISGESISHTLVQSVLLRSSSGVLFPQDQVPVK